MSVLQNAITSPNATSWTLEALLWFAGLPGTGIAIDKPFATLEGAKRGHYCEFVIASQTKRKTLDMTII
jgi:hypothetical protein